MDNFMVILLTIQTYPYKHNLLKLKEHENSFIKTFYSYKEMSRSGGFTSEFLPTFKKNIAVLHKFFQTQKKRKWFLTYCIMYNLNTKSWQDHYKQEK